MANSQKIHLHQACIAILQEKIDTLKKNIKDAQQAASEDTKSSAGDKFETSREMIKQEINKQVSQLSNNNEMLDYLNKIKLENPMNKVGFGSLVQTNEGRYYFSVSLGKVSLEGEVYFAISLASPVGKALLDKQEGDKVVFMGREIVIKGIL